jgi:hypothetical protein
MPPSATNSSEMNVVMPVHPGEPLNAKSAEASSGNKDDFVLGFIMYEMIKCESVNQNPFCTPEKLVALAAQCKNQVYVQTMKKCKCQHETVAKRLDGAKGKLEEKVGKKLTALLKAHTPVKTQYGCSIGKKRVRTSDSVDILIAYAKLHEWKPKTKGNVHHMTPMFTGWLNTIETI